MTDFLLGAILGALIHIGGLLTRISGQLEKVRLFDGPGGSDG